MAKAKNDSNSHADTPEPSTASQPSPPSGAALPSVPISDSSNSVVVVKSEDKTNDGSSSHNISISSITEDDNGDGDSSAFDSSDSECDDEQIKKAIECIPSSLSPGSQLVQNGGMLVVKDDNEGSSPRSGRGGPNIGSIAVQNSSDITFGNKTYIKGQVVIKNIYRDKQNGTVNQGYNETDGELNGSKQNSAFPSKSNEPQTWLSSVKVVIKDKPLLSVLILVAVMLIITTIIIVTYVATSADKDFFPDAKPLRIVTRNEWLAQPPKENLTLLKLPVHQVIIAHTATEGCNTQTSCVYRVRFIQEQHININNYGDISYNFLIGGDGQVYEGRGWLKVGAFLRGQNSKSQGIAFIGDYRRYEATKAQLDALDFLLENGTNSGYLTADFKLYGANQLQITESPGTMLYEQLKKHKHWDESPPIKF